jgi:hypothetical protein
MDYAWVRQADGNDETMLKFEYRRSNGHVYNSFTVQKNKQDV